MSVDSDVVSKIREIFVRKEGSGGLFSPLEQLVIFGQASNEIVDVKKPADSQKPSE